MVRRSPGPQVPFLLTAELCPGSHPFALVVASKAKATLREFDDSVNEQTLNTNFSSNLGWSRAVPVLRNYFLAGLLVNHRRWVCRGRRWG